MHQGVIIFMTSLLFLASSQGYYDTCKCSNNVIVVSREEMIQEIRMEVAANNANVTSIVQKEMDKLFEKVEKLVKPIATKLSLLQATGKFPSHPASSCKEILAFEEKSPSGHYWLRASDGSVVKVYCDMTRTCGSVTGGWMKVAELDMTNVSNQCPEPLNYRAVNGKRTCASRLNSGGCASVKYTTHGIGYNEVCGKIIGYQVGSTDGVKNGGSINGPYVDGVSLTHGHRRHIWSFISALHEAPAYSHATCYCANRNYRGRSPPSFVGQDYFCDTGNVQHNVGDSGRLTRFYNDPLWDGAGCGPQNDCCAFHNPPWFYKNLAYGTSDDIEMRVCRDEAATNEDVLIEQVDIYVR